MLEANKSKWFEKIFGIYNRNLLKRRFNSLKVSGLESFLNKRSDFPLLIYSNHSSWWDGLVIFEILKKFSFENYVMMEDKQLKKLKLFRKLGAFSVTRENPREGLKSINYAVRKLSQNSNAMVLIFPQGKIEPNDLRPIKFYNGISRIVEKTINCNMLPISIRYEFSNNYKPEIYVKIGEIKYFQNQKNFKSKILSDELESELTELLNSLITNVINGDLVDFENLL